MIIDHSAHEAWQFCPASWYEKYINNRRKKWPKAQRDDALALGSLVHAGLEVWQLTQTVEIPTKSIDENTPTKDCLDLALELVYGYAKMFPQEYWPLIHCEKPLTFPLATELMGLAKIDSYFYVPEETDIDSGIPGQRITLTPGWWIHEYKTKSPKISVGIYLQSWQVGLQASYQTMALTHALKQNVNYDVPVDAPMHVQGVLVNVLEKPERRVPKRLCKQCKDYHEFYLWLPTGTGMYACPICGNRQKLEPVKQGDPVKPPNYYRVLVTRDQAQLDADREMIIQVGQRMIWMEQHGIHSEPWTKKNCVDTWWKRECDYFSPHANGDSTLESLDYQEVPDYRGLIQLEGQ
jgi:PD-(D/E)XK nuclease superfamily